MDVIGIGVPFMDLLLGVSEIPPANGMAKLSDYLKQGGGKVATALATASRLGKTTGMIGVTGNDKNGKFILDDLKYNGVDTSRIIIDEFAESPFVVAISESLQKDRRFLGTLGTIKRLTKENIDENYIKSAKVLHLESATGVTIKAAEMAKENGTIVTFDGDYYAEDTKKILPFVDVFIGSEQYYIHQFENGNYEENCKKMLNSGTGSIIFTLGEKGCVGYSANEFFQLPCYNVDVVDTTGAGDVFHGAFIVAMLDGKTHKESANFASAVAAIKCTRIGGRTAIPDMQTVMHFIKTGNIDYTEIDQRMEHYRRER